MKPIREAQYELKQAINSIYNTLHIEKDKKSRELFSYTHPEVMAIKKKLEALDEAQEKLKYVGVL